MASPLVARTRWPADRLQAAFRARASRSLKSGRVPAPAGAPTLPSVAPVVTVMATKEQRIQDAVTILSQGTKAHVHTELDEDDTPLVFMFVAPPPNEILCPICLDIMKDAVITPYGHSYCQKCVSKYASTAGLCPLTRKPLAEDQLTPNLLARTIVDEMEVFCPHGIKLGDNGWVEDPDGCTQKIKFGLRKPHLLTCLHANVECPAGGQRCGPIARMDVDFHLEEECQFSGRNKTEEVSENYVRANTTLQLFGVSFVVLAAFLVLLFQMGVLRDSISRVIWPIVGLLSIPAGVVAAAVLLEGRIVDAEFAEKLE